MVDLGVCIETFFPGASFEEKLAAIKKLGYTTYEFWFHNKRFTGSDLVDEMKDFAAIAELNAKYGLRTNDFVLNHPDGGIVAALINREDTQKIVDALPQMIQLAQQIGCKKFISGSGNVIKGQTHKDAVAAMVESLKVIGPICAEAGMEIILEPFNSRVDHPDYFLDNPQVAVDVVKKVGLDNVKILFDIYHMQIMYGNILDFVKENLQYIGHFHIAGVPGRHEPIDNEMNYPYIIKAITEMGYTGAFGLEYFPLLESKRSLKMTRKHLLR
jgi:hydroxypyruvate isomerase